MALEFQNPTMFQLKLTSLLRRPHCNKLFSLLPTGSLQRDSTVVLLSVISQISVFPDSPNGARDQEAAQEDGRSPSESCAPDCYSKTDKSSGE